MKLSELIRRTRTDINSRIAKHNSITEQLSELRGADTPDEAKVAQLLTERQTIGAERAALATQLEAYEAEQREDEAVARLQATTTSTDAPAATREQVARVGAEPRTYTRETDPKGRMFLRDVVGDFMGNRDARERLSRHMVEEKAERGVLIERGVTTSSAPGLVVPQYLVDLYAAKGRPGRKFADQCRHHDLPETGMTAYIPRQTVKTTVDDQATQLLDVDETDYEDENIAVTIRTAAGSQTMSRQSVERGLGTEDIVMEDLLKAFDANLDSKLLTSATWGLLAVANVVAYTDAAPTAGELYRKILGAAAGVEDVLLDLDEDDLFTLMRGRRWAWLQAELTDKWPFIAAQGFPVQAGGESSGAGYKAGVRGRLPNGGDVVSDNNLPNNLGVGTNEDVMVVVARQEAHLWEDPNAPLFIRAENGPNMKKLGIDLVIYGYYAGCFDRVVDEQGTPKAVHQKITGTGLVAPIF